MALDDNIPFPEWKDWDERLVALAAASGALRGRMSIVTYLSSARLSPYYRMLLDVLVAEESRLGLHLPTTEIARRATELLSEAVGAPTEFPPVEPLLTRLYNWRNVERIPNTQRKGSVQEFLKQDFLYQMTSDGTRVHRELTRLDEEIGNAGALQAAMLPEVLHALEQLATSLKSDDEEKRPALAAGALARVFNGFTQLTENAKLFVQGLSRSLEPGRDVETDAFLAYKAVVVEYLRTFSVGLSALAADIAHAISDAEDAGIADALPVIARVDAAPVLGVALEDMIEENIQVLRARWSGLRSWFFSEHDRPPMVSTLQERAVEAVNRIVALIRRMNDQRFRRFDRQTDLRILARWFEAADSRADVVALWRAAFGTYSARHFGHPHPLEDDQDLRPATSWWEGDAVEISARLRKHGPRSRTGRPARVTDPSAAKKFLQAKRQAEGAAAGQAAATLAQRCPSALSGLGPLSEAEFAVLIRCLDIALAARRRQDGSRRAVSSDGQLKVVLADPPEPDAWAVVESCHGRIRLQDFTLSLEVVGVAR
ncbi:TIGR02677 family protein [Lentzea sp. NPDC034063]|uniref:TIGR02677 family protein n=1 Tax=unclassified Lentzea TaxID=2643253 RepID=UPI0033C0E9BD